MQRDRDCVLTDRLQCPECEGTGQQAIGPLRMVCMFCRGLGYVGDDNEPAEDNREPSGPMRPIWEEPAVRTIAVCHMCLGAGKVVNLGGTGEPTGKMIEMPCPACSAGDNERSGDQ